ncbi:MAG: CinA family protein [Alphaproteobacteria bacterium]|nr:CinA family protein [Alphaproteobacteria bacterium]
MQALISDIFEHLKRHGGMLATAESCTGGMIAAMITDVPGSSAYFDRGFVTYSNESKRDQLKVPDTILEQYGAVSEQTALWMAEGALAHSRALIAVSVTGIAGPGGGSADKPVGLVYIACARRNSPVQAFRHNFTGNRQDIRKKSAQAALVHIRECLA